VRDLFKRILIGIALFTAPQVFAGDYRLLVLPDNIVTENSAVDSFIYNATSEFFADEIINLLNNTDNITSPTISETRINLKNDPSKMLAAKALTSRFKTTYNVDYSTLKKIAEKTNSKYVLLLTSTIDSENYILRRTLWDFLNIPGATVIDPAYKISTYAVLVDTEKNSKLWSDTYYKTISTCENRIITRGPSPQTEQLQKIKDYSRYICPQIAENVQKNILLPEDYANESQQIYYDMGNIDNVFTKKYRHLNKEYDKVYQQRKSDVVDFTKDTKIKIDKAKEEFKAYQAESKSKKELKKQQKQSKLEVKATPLYGEASEEKTENINNSIKDGSKDTSKNIINAIFKKKNSELEYPELIEIEIEKKKKNNLFGDYNQDRPALRNYY